MTFSVARFFWPLRAVFLVLSCGIFFVVVVGNISENRGAEQRGRLVLSVIQGEVQVLAASEDSERVLRKASSWPDDYVVLRHWLLVTLARKTEPSVAAAVLRDLSRGRSFSPRLQASMDRWNDDLQRWSRSARDVRVSSSHEILGIMRRLYFEANGYSEIGRSYDVTVLVPWIQQLLYDFVRKTPGNPAVSEGLYLMGSSYMRLKTALPIGNRSDRFVNLCSELYPGSAWGQHAADLWRDEMGYGV